MDRVYFSEYIFEANESDSNLEVQLNLERSSGSSHDVKATIKTRDLELPNSAKGTYVLFFGDVCMCYSCDWVTI